MVTIRPFETVGGGKESSELMEKTDKRMIKDNAAAASTGGLEEGKSTAKSTAKIEIFYARFKAVYDFFF